MKCKDCKYFDCTKPVSTAKGNIKNKIAAEYVGMCTNVKRIVMMNDSCSLSDKEEKKK